MQEKIDHRHSALTSFHRKRQITGWMFALPAVIFLCVFVFYPVLYNVWLSLTNAKRLSSDNLQFVGLKNYIKLFTDKTLTAPAPLRPTAPSAWRPEPNRRTSPRNACTMWPGQ